MRWSFLLVLCVLPFAAGASQDDCRGDTVALAPLEPLALSPHDALDEEQRLRDVLTNMKDVCLLPRAQSAKVLSQLPGLRVPACADAACRKKQVNDFGAKWLLSGTVYGLGGGRTVSLALWSADGAIVQRGAYTGSDPERTVTRLLSQARLGHSLVADGVTEPNGADWKLRWPQVALGGAAVTALAVGGGFGYASLRTENRLTSQATGCQGEGPDYQRCFADEYERGRAQARTANVLYGLAAVLGATCAVSFALEWP